MSPPRSRYRIRRQEDELPTDGEVFWNVVLILVVVAILMGVATVVALTV